MKTFCSFSQCISVWNVLNHSLASANFVTLLLVPLCGSLMNISNNISLAQTPLVTTAATGFFSQILEQLLIFLPYSWHLFFFSAEYTQVSRFCLLFLISSCTIETTIAFALNFVWVFLRGGCWSFVFEYRFNADRGVRNNVFLKYFFILFHYIIVKHNY